MLFYGLSRILQRQRTNLLIRREFISFVAGSHQNLPPWSDIDIEWLNDASHPGGTTMPKANTCSVCLKHFRLHQLVVFQSPCHIPHRTCVKCLDHVLTNNYLNCPNFVKLHLFCIFSAFTVLSALGV